VVLADDEPLVLSGLRAVLSVDPDIEVVEEATDGVQAVAAVREHVPDVALLDIRMPRMDGLDAVAAVTGDPSLAAVRSVLLTTFADDAYLVAAARAGAAGYLLKSMPPERIRAAVHDAARGELTVAPALVERLLLEYAERRVPADPRLAALTDRESTVLAEIARGRSNAEIAGRLFVSEGTVKTHVAAVLRKLGLRDRTQAAVAAYELGLVRPGDR
jgi:DNA-binding NarL/FixJ family response regulator